MPTAAIQRGPNGAFVYVLKDDNTVTVRRVTLTQQDDVRAVVGERPAGRRAGGHDRLCPPHRGHAGHGVERRRCRTGRARTVAPRPDGTRGTRAGERGKRSSSAAAAGHARHERVLALHPAADRDIAARDRGHAGRHPRLPVAAGVVAAAGRFPHHPGHDPASGREPRRDGVAGDGAARAQFRADSRRSR